MSGLAWRGAFAIARGDQRAAVLSAAVTSVALSASTPSQWFMSSALVMSRQWPKRSTSCTGRRPSLSWISSVNVSGPPPAQARAAVVTTAARPLGP